MADLTTHVNGIVFANPVLPAAGPNVRTADMMVRAVEGGAGGIVTKTVSIEPASDARPTIRSAPKGGLLNCESWAESDLDTFLEGLASLKTCRKKNGVPLVVSIGYKPEEVSRLARIFDREIQPDAFEFSTHYTGHSVEPLLEVARALREATRVPIWLKLSPGFPDIPRLVTAAAPLIDSFVAINSFGPVLDCDGDTGRPLLGSRDGQGWLSGPPILPLALRIVHQVSSLQEKPVIGVGGIENGADAIKFIMAGASLVQVCTAAIKRGHGVYGKIASQMASWLEQHDRGSLHEVQGLYGHVLRQAATFRQTPVMRIDPRACTACGACVGRCIQGALSMADEKTPAVVRDEACIGCGYCQDFCPADAMGLAEP